MIKKMFIQVWRDPIEDSGDLYFDITDYLPFRGVSGFDTYRNLTVENVNVMLFSLFDMGQCPIDTNEFRRVLQLVFPDQRFVPRAQ